MITPKHGKIVKLNRNGKQWFDGAYKERTKGHIVTVCGMTNHKGAATRQGFVRVKWDGLKTTEVVPADLLSAA